VTKQEAKERIKHLRKVIDRHRYLYHVLDREEISAEALDSLKKELFDLEQKFPELITSDSPTQRVGGEPLKEFKKIAHTTRMNSLSDAFSEEDVKDWLTRLENYLFARTNAEKDADQRGKFLHQSALSQRLSAFYCDLKMDGLAVELIYENGILKTGSTRGDGLVGEDITQNLKTIDAIPLKLSLPSGYTLYPKTLVVRGETFLTKKEFARINKEQEKQGAKSYANPRNVAAGSIRQLDPKITASRKLDFYAYGIVAEPEAYQTHANEFKILSELGFKTNPNGRVVSTLDEVFAFQRKWEKEREKLPYEIDGIVVFINDNKIFSAAGIIGKAPRAAIAYKFSPREATTVVENIKVQVGRTGALTPVAVMKPANVGGITITHATLHNADEIERLGLKIGDTVVVSRAGDVIPKITKVLAELRSGKEKNFHMPEKCPVDGSRVIKDGVIFRCSNKNCAAQLRESIYHFISRGAFNMEGLGPKIIDRFLDEGLISDAADIFTLKEKEGDIATLERFGEKSAENIVEEVEGRKAISLPRFIYSLGILHVGEETSILISKKFPAKDMKELLEKYSKLSIDKLQEIHDIGPKVAESIYNWFREKQNLKFLDKLEKAGISISNSGQQTSNAKLAGKTFVLTGSLINMSRDEAKEKIRLAGGEVSESVSNKTDYCLAGTNPGSKFNKAKQLGVEVLNEKQFLNLIK